ncbi:hypothetical protein [Limimaricola cinnabarinus]|uniref:hypothetical protein n=1 Tax=Limimaricola cinnabarinus TaxID=1125964 RepID=UPI0013A60B0A|nr:hypothetical protein [Limimaricola cinnabarinus]
MSYESINYFPAGTSLKRIKEVVELLGYKSVPSWVKTDDMVGSYVWYESSEYKSWSGVELSIYKSAQPLELHTRSTVSRSYWDLTHQNKTIRVLKDLFGGTFETDAGKGRYYRPDFPPPSPLSSGCYLARWRFHNALGKAHVYLGSRILEGNIALDGPNPIPFLDSMNPRLLSNNLLIPYIIAVWEEYFRATFAAVLRYADKREIVLKRARLSHAQLEQIAAEKQIERAISECFSFQRPSIIGENFRLIDPKLDLASAMRKPYNGRKTTLYDSIEDLIEGRNAFVHAGHMNMRLFDKKTQTTLSDLVVAIDRAYNEIGSHFSFTPIKNY